jgi:hypothetical protein
MPALVRYVLSNFAIGFTLGAAAAIALIAIRLQRSPSEDLGAVAIWLQVFALGSPMGLGFLGTALSLDAER